MTLCILQPRRENIKTKIASLPLVCPFHRVWLHVQVHGEGTTIVQLDRFEGAVVQLEALEVDDEKVRQMFQAGPHPRVLLFPAVFTVHLIRRQTCVRNDSFVSLLCHVLSPHTRSSHGTSHYVQPRHITSYKTYKRKEPFHPVFLLSPDSLPLSLAPPLP